MKGSLLPVLAALKLRLLYRSFTRGGGGRAIATLLFLALAFAPMWLGLTSTAYQGALRWGAPAVAAGLGLVHLGWVATSLLLGAFAEGFDLRLFLRYPVPLRTAFWLNVLIAPAEFTGLFLLPPLVALAVGSAARAGLGAGLLVGVAGLLTLFITSALAQALFALIGRYLRREWTRALAGLAFGLLFAVPAILLQGPGRRSGALLERLEALAEIADRAFSFLPTTALPVRAVHAAFASPTLAVAWLVATALALLVFVELCARLAASEAQNREAPATADAPALRGGRTLESRLEALLPVDLALLVARELRTYARTPQLLVGFFTAPFVVLMLSRNHQTLGRELVPFFVALASLLIGLNVSSNQFGLDQAGVRFFFLLPLPAQRLLMAKNLAIVSVTALAALICLGVARALGMPIDVIGALTALAALAAALPVVLTFGNRLSIQHPWRMTFRMGGAPPGVMLSALAQMLAIGVSALALVPALVLLPMFYGKSTPIRLGSLAIIVVMAATLWFLWRLFLDNGARMLDARREQLIDRLAKPGETG